MLPPVSAVSVDEPRPPPSPTLTLEAIAGPYAGRSYPIAGPTACTLGRGPEGVTLAFPGDGGMSRLHFLIEYVPPLAGVVDLNSKNKTFVNGVKVRQCQLRDQDVIRAGHTQFRLRLPEAPHPAGERTHDLPASADSLPSVPGFAILSLCGKGGMGVVYRACREPAGEVVAIKMVLPAVPIAPLLLGRFLRESKILQQLEHPNVIRYLDSGESAGMLYFVMEYVDGPSAADLVKLQGPMPEARVIDLGDQLLRALACAHRQGFVHRDVKPANVLLSRVDGREVLKLADFGLARQYQESALSGLTISGTAGGTPGFMAPEQVAEFRDAQPSADLYATAATLYHLLTGEHVYERAATMADRYRNILNREPLPLRSPPEGPALPAKLGAVLCRALAREPARRYANAEAMRAALIECR